VKRDERTVNSGLSVHDFLYTKVNTYEIGFRHLSTLGGGGLDWLWIGLQKTGSGIAPFLLSLLCSRVSVGGGCGGGCFGDCGCVGRFG
jgi:hypothetical protein